MGKHKGNIKTTTICTFPDCGRDEVAVGLCRGHYTQKARGKPLRPLEDRSGWNRNSYNAVHVRLYRTRGPAKTYTCPCGKPAEEWSYDGDDPNEVTGTVRGWNGKVHEVTYSLDFDHYTARCKSCHVRLDRHERSQPESVSP